MMVVFEKDYFFSANSKREREKGVFILINFLQRFYQTKGKTQLIKESTL